MSSKLREIDMATRYQDISYGTFGGGIDQLSPENKIPDDFVELLQNIDPTPNGSLVKRQGTQLYGSVPVRVQRLEYDAPNDEICFYLDSAVDVLSLRSTPIHVLGRTSSAHAGDFTNVDGSQYYTEFRTDVKQTVAAGTELSPVVTDVVLEGTAHNQGPQVSVLVARSTSGSDVSNEQYFADSYTVDATTADITVEVKNAGTTEFETFIVATSRATEPGYAYIHTGTTALGANSVTISAATHNLNNFSILIDAYLLIAGEYQRIFLPGYTIASNGTVTASFTYNDSDNPSVPFYLFLSVADSGDIITGNVPVNEDFGETGFPILVPNLATHFPIFQAFQQVGTSLEALQVDNVVVNSVTNTAIVYIKKPQNNPILVYTLVWNYANLVGNKLCVDAHTSGTSYADSNPQMTIWGLPHRQLYAAAEGATPGYVTHVDTYRAQAEERAVCGLGGNLFAAYEYYEAEPNWGMRSYYPNLRGRVDSPTIIGPAFIAPPASGVPTRTAGAISFTESGRGVASVLSSTHITGNRIKLRLYMPNRIIYNTSIAAIFNSNEYLTVSNMGYSINNGEFRIYSVQDLNPYVDVTVVNTAVSDSQWNETNSDGTAGIFTDTIPLSDTCVFNTNDRLQSSAFGAAQYLTVTASSEGNNLRLAGLYASIELPDGLLIVGERSSHVIPLRALNSEPNTDNLVAGDVLSYTGIGRELRAKYVNANPDEIVSVLLTDTTATVFLANSDLFSVGQRILLFDGVVFTGEHVINSITSPTTLTFESDGLATLQQTVSLDGTTDAITLANHGLVNGTRVTIFNTSGITNFVPNLVYYVINSTTNTFQISLTSGGSALDFSGAGIGYLVSEVSCKLIGYTVEVDEALDWSDSLTSQTVLNTARRWIPIEAPASGYTQIPFNRYRYLTSSDYDDQPFLRSTMVNNTLYGTNGLDAVQRYDGQNITRAGFFRWQAGLYLTADTTTPKITLSNIVIQDADVKSINANIFTITKGKEKSFAKGDTVRYSRIVSGSNQVSEYVIIKDPWEDGTDGFIEVNADGQGLIAGTAETLAKVSIFSYYYRLNLIDVNGNQIASAVTNAQDARIAVSASCSIRHLLLRPPFLDNMDFASIQIQIYRTKANSSGPYYLVGTVNPKWNTGGDAYVEFIDSENDNTLLAQEVDEVNSVLVGGELGQTWSGPLRSKYITSISGSLVLANFRTWPTLTITPERKPTVSSLTFTSYANKRMLLRRSNTDIDTNTDNLNRMGFEFIYNTRNDITITSSTITDTDKLTINKNSHGLVAGNWVYLTHYDNTPHAVTDVNPRLGGYYQVYDVPTANSFRIQISSELVNSITITPLSSIDVNTYVTATDKTDIPVWISTDKLYDTLGANLQRTFSATISLINGSPTVTTASTSRIEVGAYVSASGVPAGTRVLSITNATTFVMDANATSGLSPTATFTSSLSIETYAFLRLANAINAAQAACSAAGFSPWVVANAGGEYTRNELVLEVPYVTDTTLEAVLPSFTDLDLYANGVIQAGGAQVQAQVQLFPSRLLISYQNYPELFDSPTAVQDTDSDSAIDVNPSDGQEITGCIPFFGKSAFGAAQNEQFLLVFKTASVYVINITQKRLGSVAVQRLDTRGLGCTAPLSIAPTQNGIMFANQSGIYRITSGLECQYIGRRVERLWQDSVDTSNIETNVFGHYYPLGNQYKLSVPYTADETSHPARTLVYSTVREYSQDGYRDGSWTAYKGIEAIGWANMLQRAIYASPHGEVFTLRSSGDASDYRDDGVAIEAVATLRALDFGSSGVRKMISGFTVQFRPEEVDTTPIVEATVDLIDDWEVLDEAIVTRYRGRGGITAQSTQQLAIIQYMSNKRKGVFYQLRISNTEIDEGLQIAGVSMNVAGIGAGGILQARETQSR